MVRVLQITVRSDFGGGPKQLYDIVLTGQSEIIYDVACPKQAPFWNLYHGAINGVLIEIPGQKLSILSIFDLYKHIIKFNVGIIHTHGKGAGLYGRILSLITGVKLIHTPHGIHVGEYNFIIKKLYLLYEHITSFTIHKVISVSQSECDLIKSLKIYNKKKINLINHGISDGVGVGDGSINRVISRDKLGLNITQKICVTLSRFDYQKNLIEAVRIASKLPNITFYFLSDGPDKNSLVNFCLNNNINNVIFTGFVDDPKLYISIADIYLSTSRWEGLPASLLIAMSLEKPIVATDVTGHSDLVSNGINGFLYRLGDIHDAAQKINLLFNNQDLCRAYGLSGHQLQLKKYNLRDMTNNIVDLYRQASCN